VTTIFKHTMLTLKKQKQKERERERERESFELPIYFLT
jgi:hypothetical protein